MNACYQKDFNRQRENVVRADRHLVSDECDRLPLHARQLTASTAHALRVQLKPALPPTVPGFAIDALSRPASFVGGDYFNCQEADDHRVGVLIFDVAGKGPEAALIATRLRSLFHKQAGSNGNIKDVLTGVNAQLSSLLADGRFATALYGILDPAERRFSFARAGHEPLVLVREGQPKTLAPQGLPLGIGEHDEFADLLEIENVELEANDRLFMFTDGLTEARNHDDDEFGLDRILGELRASQGNDVGALTSAVTNFVQSEPAHDDLTMLSIRVLH